MSRRNKTIDHEGVVTQITPTEIYVEILNKSMCAACHAKSACTMSDMSIKRIKIYRTSNEVYHVGEEVLVVMKKTLGLRAVWISYVIPLIILMILLLSLPYLNFSELGAGLMAVLGVSLYYVGVFLFRDRLAKEFTFAIEKKH
ncbi:MAG: S1 RNA-binding domain-containing protein [Bacteroidales bacterium]|nr:S1 RNA-binding domain-containing protein [Bacteroidales bacterium]